MMAGEEVKVLKSWEEVVGMLDDHHLYDDGDGFRVEISGVGGFEFMSFEEDYIKFLNSITKIPVGSKIGILRTDDGYRVRVIE